MEGAASDWSPAQCSFNADAKHPLFHAEQLEGPAVRQRAIMQATEGAALIDAMHDGSALLLERG